MAQVATYVKDNMITAKLTTTGDSWDWSLAFPDNPNGLLIESIECATPIKGPSSQFYMIVRDSRDPGNQMLARFENLVTSMHTIKYFNTAQDSRRYYFPVVKSDERTTGVILVITLL
jgi:hypothetical protein